MKSGKLMRKVNRSENILPRAAGLAAAGLPTILGMLLSIHACAKQEQLGLKLGSSRALVAVLAIDHVEPPWQN
jgi:hypothetical protein